MAGNGLTKKPSSLAKRVFYMSNAFSLSRENARQSDNR